MAGGLAGVKRLADMVPATLLNTADRDLHRGLGWHQHVRVQNPVLLCTHQFLPIHQKHPHNQIVHHLQLRHAAALVDLRDLNKVQCLGSQQFVGWPFVRPPEDRYELQFLALSAIRENCLRTICNRL